MQELITPVSANKSLEIHSDGLTLKKYNNSDLCKKINLKIKFPSFKERKNSNH